MWNQIETESENCNFLKYGRKGKHPMQSIYTGYYLSVALPASDVDVDVDVDAHSPERRVAGVGVDVNISSYTPSPLSKSIATCSQA